MGQRVKVIAILLIAAAMTAGGQSSTEDKDTARPAQARGYWVDPATGLKWTAKDNGKAVTWHTAATYCRKLRLAGFSDWRLATLEELASLVDKNTPAPERAGNGEIIQINIGRHVRGNWR